MRVKLINFGSYPERIMDIVVGQQCLTTWDEQNFQWGCCFHFRFL